ncbi:MAG: cysteine desulfurase family protein [Pyrinomonadaceae bacterium]
MFRRIYMDHSATTPVDPRVVEAMMPYLTEAFGNASSIHYFGQQARAAVDKARHQVAHLIGARPNEIVFTSGGTESNNLAIKGVLDRWNADILVRMSAASTRTSAEHPHAQIDNASFSGGIGVGGRSGDTPVPMSVASTRTSAEHPHALTGNASFAGGTGDGDKSVPAPHIITSSIEHSAVKNVCEDLEKQGYRVTYLPVYEDGIVRIEDVKAAITDDTLLISIMAANNEIGTIQPIEEVGKFVRELRAGGQKIWFHTDAVQAAGKVPINVEEIGCDLLSISAHKLYAPKGVGALYVRRGVRLHPQNIGGHQERERRGGTESVPNIAAFGKACELAEEEIASESTTLKDLRDKLETRVGEMIPDVVFNGDRDRRLPNISNISFRSVEGEGLLINLDMQGIAVSTGSACSSGTLEPSPVIRALGPQTPSSAGGDDEDRARGAIRFSLGRTNTAADVDRLLEVLPTSVENLRRLTASAR